MKIKYTIGAFAAASLTLLSSCDGKKDSHAGHDHSSHSDHKHDHDDKGSHADHDHSGDDHGHAHVVAGPNKGRMVDNAEFLVTKERKIMLSFFDSEMKPVPAPSTAVTCISGERSNPVEFTFTTIEGKLISNETLPTGNNFPTVIQLKENTKEQRFNLDLTVCPSCPNPEYSCTCHH